MRDAACGVLGRAVCQGKGAEDQNAAAGGRQNALAVQTEGNAAAFLDKETAGDVAIQIVTAGRKDEVLGSVHFRAAGGAAADLQRAVSVTGQRGRKGGVCMVLAGVGAGHAADGVLMRCLLSFLRQCRCGKQRQAESQREQQAQGFLLHRVVPPVLSVSSFCPIRADRARERAPLPEDLSITAKGGCDRTGQKFPPPSARDHYTPYCRCHCKRFFKFFRFPGGAERLFEAETALRARGSGFPAGELWKEMDISRDISGNTKNFFKKVFCFLHGNVQKWPETGGIV